MQKMKVAKRHRCGGSYNVEQIINSEIFFWGGGGGGACLSAQRAVMAMMIIPLPHYDNFFVENF